MSTITAIRAALAGSLVMEFLAGTQSIRRNGKPEQAALYRPKERKRGVKMTKIARGALAVALGIVLFFVLAEVGYAMATIRNVRVLAAIGTGIVALFLIVKW